MLPCWSQAVQPLLVARGGKQRQGREVYHDAVFRQRIFALSGGWACIRFGFILYTQQRSNGGHKVGQC